MAFRRIIIAIPIFMILYFLPAAISGGIRTTFIYGIGLLFYIWIGSLLVIGVKALLQKTKKQGSS